MTDIKVSTLRWRFVRRAVIAVTLPFAAVWQVAHAVWICRTVVFGAVTMLWDSAVQEWWR